MPAAVSSPPPCFFCIRKRGGLPVQVLEELVHLHPVPRLMQEFRTLTKILGDFLHIFDRRARRASFGTPGTVSSCLASCCRCQRLGS